MEENLINGAARPGALRALDKARSIGGAGTGEIPFIFSSSVSTSSELTSRKRLLRWRAAPISNVRQAAYHCWAAPVFMLAICPRFSSAERDKKCVPSFSNRVLHLLSEIDFRKATRDAMTCMDRQDMAAIL
jgi:hypothetical protein